MPVLITAGSSQEAYRLQRILERVDSHFGDQHELPQIPGKKNFVLPHWKGSSFAHETLKICLDNQIDTLYPLKFGEILELSTVRTLFFEYGIKLMIPSEQFLADNNSSFLRINNPTIAVLDSGKLVFGELPFDDNFPSHENGIFCWATNNQYIEYSIYVVYEA